MSLQHSRHADVLAIVAPLAIAAPLGRQLAVLTAAQPPSRLFRCTARLARPAAPTAFAVTLFIAAMLALPTLVRPIARGDDLVTPASALAAAEQAGLSGPVFNSEAFGGYLVFKGVPTLIDGRIEMYGNDFLARDYAAEQGHEPELQQTLDRYRIAWALLVPQSGAAIVLANRSGWQQIYKDRYAVVFRRTGPPPG
jgi:hypothetical protein